MTAENEPCIAGPSLTYLTCLVQIFLDWLGLENLEDYLNYLDYLMWVFTPLIIVFILPFLIVIFLYLSILFLHVYKRKNELKEAYSNSIWDGARKTLATLWDGHAAIWHGYEIYGLEKIPDSGPALIVYYHGALPVDYYYFVAKVILLKGRTCHSVGDHFLFKIPGFKPLLEVFSVIHGPKEECVKALRNGHLLAISPGGVREALFSDETYTIMWGNRTGFAQVAIDAKVLRHPISRLGWNPAEEEKMAPPRALARTQMSGRHGTQWKRPQDGYDCPAGLKESVLLFIWGTFEFSSSLIHVF
ncbi:DGAT1/2-independent enzyme synthesizing storage lipids isoform X2 [Pyxicephalus adspersus]|uniref:DGAT1/2-independent enzyme synthesizing storage lipids isoform X2 n=1 Tax=Pyxicephalus adspersus TaxID=30357 RepID=UPI003B5CF3CE